MEGNGSPEAPQPVQSTEDKTNRRGFFGKVLGFLGLGAAASVVATNFADSQRAKESALAGPTPLANTFGNEQPIIVPEATPGSYTVVESAVSVTPTSGLPETPTPIPTNTKQIPTATPGLAPSATKIP